MTSSQSFGEVVALYRAAGKPLIEGVRFKGEITSTSCEYLNSLRNEDHEFGRFEELTLDNTEILPSEELPAHWDVAKFTWILASNSNCKFYSDLTELTSSTGKGYLPEHYYILALDHADTDPITTEIQQITTICTLIKSLSVIADYHDEKNDSNCFNLIFTQYEGDTSSKTTAIKTRISSQGLRSINISLATSLAQEDESSDIHHQSKIYTFKSSIVEFCDLTKPEDRFEKLITEWDVFLKLYNNNLSTYLSGFSFHKAKKEVASAQISIAEQLSKITSETTTRVLSIPISFAAIIGLLNLKSLPEALLIFAGLLILSFITTAAISNQNKQLSRLIASRKITFTAFQGKASSYPDDLNTDITEAKTALEANERYLIKTLLWYRALGWLPTLIAIITIVINFGPSLREYKTFSVPIIKLFSAVIIIA
ncbi:hypothetical protein [Pseudomonas sp. H3(2019)]|uniref:hypothetical protein n=1 Tax=Pseudomonas sp. H3(2019) TaxID=2598724 RepID=UPI00118EB4F4|nr:hypothetical protein [Pseudomonas sp. H3(2019)]TVT81117.1 hypothetical protein FPT12_20670 [Pseudomonas sp. H3(2019)]